MLFRSVSQSRYPWPTNPTTKTFCITNTNFHIHRRHLLLRFTPILAARRHQCIPIIERITSPQHLLEHCIRIELATCRAQGLLVVDPGKHDHLHPGVVAKEQAKSPSDLRPPPMAEHQPQNIALTELVARKIA